MLCFALFSASFTAHAASEKVEIEPQILSVSDKSLSLSSDRAAAAPAAAVSSSGTHYIEYGLYARDYASGQYVSGSVMGSHTYNYPWASNLTYPDYNVRDYTWSNYLLCDNYSIYRQDGTVMGSKGMTLRLQLNNIGNSILQGANSSSTTRLSSDISNYNNVILLLESPTGQSKYVTFSPTDVLTKSTKYPNYAINLYLETELTFDVVKVSVEINYRPQYAFSGLNPNSNNWIYKTSAFNTNSGYSDIGLYIQTDNAGLLNKIINGITELPSKIWNLVENGLKGLFVPSESQMTEVKGQWDSLLSDRFGGLYQTVQLIDDYAATFKEPGSSQSSIDFPEFRLNVGSESEFVLQAHDVQIVPDRFSFLVDVVKTIISIIATCLFVNGLRNKFERLVGGHE